LKIPRR